MRLLGLRTAQGSTGSRHVWRGGSATLDAAGGGWWARDAVRGGCVVGTFSEQLRGSGCRCTIALPWL